MELARVAGWVSVGLVLATGGVYAQEPVDGGKAARRSKAAVQKVAQPDADAAQQVRRDAALRAKAEEAARQQAEAEAKKMAEIEAREKPLRDADELLKAGKPAEAYTLLEPFEFDRSGEVRFDYLLGIAALDSGKPDKATMAFERVLAVDPNFAGARLDMARAYYQLGDLPRAKTEFEEVMKQNPPEAARVTIQKYLDAIAAYEQAKLTRISGYIEGVVGHDSNINTGTGSSVAIASVSPIFAAIVTTFTGDANPQFQPSQLSDNYYGMSAGGEINHYLSDNWSVFAGANLRQHGNLVQTTYDASGVDGRAGFAYGKEQSIYRLSLSGGQSYTGNSMRRDSLGASGEWQYMFSPANQISAFVQYGQNRAAGTQPGAPTTDARIEGNTDQTVIGAGWVHIMGDGKQALFGSIFAGKEFDSAGRPDGKKKFEGVRVGGQTAFTDDVDGFASLGWQHGAYADQNLLFVAKRDEYQYDLMVGANWRLDKLWSVKPLLGFSRKNSNIALYSFDRMDVSLTIRRDFR
jgi:tetratricopeptide (TPR) repeat protein